MSRSPKKTVRFGILIGVLVYGLLFGIIDWVRETNALETIWSIRIGICVLGFCVYLIVDSRFFERFMQPVLSTLMVVAGIGLLGMIFSDDDSRAYLDGPVLVVLPAYVLFRIRFIYASVAGLIVFILYCAVIYFIEGMRASDLWASAVFLFSANLIGMVAGYELEWYARKEFWQTLRIDEERRANANLLTVKNRFFANISHEIRTPLTLILGPLEDAIHRSAQSAPKLSWTAIDAMKRNGYRLLKFLDELLELSRMDAERVPVELRRADAVLFSKKLVHSFLPYAETRDIKLEFGSPEASIQFVSDYDKLEVVLSNLVTNAVKYTMPGGHVKISVNYDAAGDQLQFEVKDNGPGIDPDALDHLFDRFYRAPATKSGNEGMGLGLSLTHSLVELLGGAIQVESELGFGTTFIVTIPGNDEDAPLYDANKAKERTLVIESAGRVEPTKDDGAEEDRAIVLVIDDHDDVRAYIKQCLDDKFEVIDAGSGQEGFDKGIHRVPDLIVLDVMMPEEDGFVMVKKIRGNDVLSHIPIVMLTASAGSEERLRGLEAGADDYMTKPFNKAELVVRVENLITMRSQLRAKYSKAILVPFELPEVASAEEQFLARVREHIEEHLNEEYYSADALAEGIGMSVRQLQRKLKALTGETPTAQIRSMRLYKARHLIESEYGTVAEIAYEVGFSNPTYFTKCFREQFGKAPTEWLEEKNGEDETDVD